MNENAQFIFNNKKLYDDYDSILMYLDIGYPELNRIAHTVPFMNGVYDFTDLYGNATWSERTITVHIRHKSGELGRSMLNGYYDNISLWLLSQPMSKLKFDHIRGYFTGRVTGFSTREAYNILGYIEVTFTCHPFREWEEYEGNNLWDPFCFETDIMQDTKFEVNGKKTVTVHNLSATSVIPLVICNDTMKVTKGGRNFTFEQGETNNPIFELAPGANTMTITGYGEIEFKFKRMVI